jgi:hypothetical protein
VIPPWFGERFVPMMKLVLVTSSLLLLATVVSAKDMPAAEINFKADFIVKVTDYVTWPEGATTNAAGEVAIAVLGDSPLTPKLKELAASRTSQGTKMSVTSVTLDDDLTIYQILFIATEDKTELAKVLKKIQNAPVLIISDAYYFARFGVMVNFYKEEGSDGKVKFEVNQMTLGMAGLKMSSKLLKLATII